MFHLKYEQHHCESVLSMVCQGLDSLDIFVFVLTLILLILSTNNTWPAYLFPSPTYDPSIRISSLFHRTTSLHTLRGDVRRPACLHHLAEGRSANPGQPGRHHWQHRFYQLLANLKPHTDAQWELHLYSAEPGCRCRAPEPAHCQRWGKWEERGVSMFPNPVLLFLFLFF